MIDHDSPAGLTVRLFGREGDKYVQHTIAEPGETLRLTRPIQVDIDLNALVSRAR